MSIWKRITGKIPILAQIALGIIFLSVVLLIVVSKLNKRETEDYTEDYKEVIVRANRPYTLTGINLSVGDIIEIEASGEIKWDENSQEPVVGPEGASWYPEQTVSGPDFEVYRAPVASLVGKIGNRVYPIGRRKVILVDGTGGDLILSINEDVTNKSAWQDNEGEFTVKVTVLRKRSKYSLVDSPIMQQTQFSIYPNGNWNTTGYYIPNNCFLTFSVSGIFSRDVSRIVFFENGEEYKNQKLYLKYKIGYEGAEHTITISDISREKFPKKEYVEQIFDESGTLFIKCIDKNYKNDRYWNINVSKYKPTEEGELLYKGAFVKESSLLRFEEGRSYLLYVQHIYPSGAWYDTRLTIPPDCDLMIELLGGAFDKKLGQSKWLNYRDTYKGITDLKGKLELLYKVGEDGEVHNIHTGLQSEGSLLCLLCSSEKIPVGGRLYISGKDENYKNDRLWQIYIHLDKIKKYSIDLKKLRNSDYRKFE